MWFFIADKIHTFLITQITSILKLLLYGKGIEHKLCFSNPDTEFGEESIWRGVNIVEEDIGR